jgi:hypothetical protein
MMFNGMRFLNKDAKKMIIIYWINLNELISEFLFL